MNIIFRTDASLDIGIGHVMRCLTLAQVLRDKGAKCHFICREHVGNLLDLIRQRGFEAQALPMQVVVQEKLGQQEVIGTDTIGEVELDWLIVDHYALDIKWEAALKPHYQKLMVIDDLADRQHGCDLLLDQNLGCTKEHYAGLVSANCKVLVGPQYALLRPEFSKLRQYSLYRRATPQLKHLLITMGGVDKDNATGQVLAALNGCALPTDCRISVVMGTHAPWLTQVRNQAAKMSWATEVLVSVDNMAKLMAESDLAIGAAGITSWERCCLGLPTMLVILANNQLKGALALVKSGSSLLLGGVEDVALNLSCLLKGMHDGVSLLNMQNSSAILTLGVGATSIANVLMSAHE